MPEISEPPDLPVLGVSLTRESTAGRSPSRPRQQQRGDATKSGPRSPRGSKRLVSRPVSMGMLGGDSQIPQAGVLLYT